MANSRTKNTVLNTIFGLIVKVVTMFSAFIVRTIFITVLGLQYAGVQGVFSDILLMLSFAELGIGSAITFALYKPIADNDEVQIGKLMHAYKTIYRVIALVVLLLGLTLTPFLGYIVHDVPDITEDIRIIFLLYVVNSASSYLLIYKTTFLTAAQKDYLVSKYRIYISVARTVLECVVLLVFGNFILYLLISIACGILQNYIIAKVAEKEYPILIQSTSQRLDKTEKKSIFANVRALFLYKVSGVVLNGTDSIVTSSILGTIWVGMLGNYYLISNQIYGFLMQIFSATSASIGNLAASSSSDHQHHVFKKMHFLCFWIYCVTSTCLWTVFAPFIKLWLGEDYLLSNIVVAAIVVEFYIRGMLSPISQFRTSNGLFVQGKYRPVIMAVLNICISIVLAKQIGLVGVILGTIISRALTQLWFDPLIIYKYVFKQSVLPFYAEYLRCLFITFTSCVLSYWCYNLVTTDTLVVNFLLASTIAFLIPNVIIYILFHRSDNFLQVCQLLKNIIKRKI